MQITATFESLEEFQQFVSSKTSKNVEKPQKTEEKAQKTSENVISASAPDPKPEPAPAPQVTMAQVTEKAISLMDAGKQTQLQTLLAKYGVMGLPQLPEEKLADFYADLGVL